METTTIQYIVHAPSKTDAKEMWVFCYDNTERNPKIWWGPKEHNPNPYTCVNPDLSFLTNYLDKSNDFSTKVPNSDKVNLDKIEIWKVTTKKVITKTEERIL